MKFCWLLWSVSSVCVLDWCVQYERERSGPAGGEDMCGDSLVRPSWWCLFSQWMAEATSDINIRNNGGITLHLRSVCDLASTKMWWIQYPLSATSWGVLKRAQEIYSVRWSFEMHAINGGGNAWIKIIGISDQYASKRCQDASTKRWVMEFWGTGAGLPRAAQPSTDYEAIFAHLSLFFDGL